MRKKKNVENVGSDLDKLNKFFISHPLDPGGAANCTIPTNEHVDDLIFEEAVVWTFSKVKSGSAEADGFTKTMVGKVGSTNVFVNIFNASLRQGRFPES